LNIGHGASECAGKVWERAVRFASALISNGIRIRSQQSAQDRNAVVHEWVAKNRLHAPAKIIATFGKPAGIATTRIAAVG
jgi:hypothetical protein